MNLRRIGILLAKETLQGPRNVMFIMAVVAPVAFTLVVRLVFGDLFAGLPTLGLVDQGDSSLAARAGQMESIRLRTFDGGDELRQAVADGRADIGIILPAGFDQLAASQGRIQLTAYVWGESRLDHRALLATALVSMIRDVSGQESPIEIHQQTVGEQVASWEQRIFPFIVLISIVIGGVLVPSSSLVEEKARRTYNALGITPATVTDVLIAKGALGVLLSVAMGVLTLVLNQALGRQPALLLLALFMGAVLASGFGVVLGALVDDINTLFASLKSLGIVLYAPALFELFPSLPQWISRLFPTHYLMAPVLAIVQDDAGWSQVGPDLAILAILILLTIGVIGLLGRRGRLQPVAG